MRCLICRSRFTPVHRLNIRLPPMCWRVSWKSLAMSDADMMDEMKPGLTRVNNSPYAGAFFARRSQIVRRWRARHLARLQGRTIAQSPAWR